MSVPVFVGRSGEGSAPLDRHGVGQVEARGAAGEVAVPELEVLRGAGGDAVRVEGGPVEGADGDAVPVGHGGRVHASELASYAAEAFTEGDLDLVGAEVKEAGDAAGEFGGAQVEA